MTSQRRGFTLALAATTVFWGTHTSARVPAIEGPTLIDERDGQSYRTIQLGGLRWMAENLRYGQAGSLCYKNQLAICKRWGRLYNFEQALRACPKGWKLPSDEDWT